LIKPCIKRLIITHPKQFVSGIIKKAKKSIILIDESIVYHIGASLKDLGKKWFAFSKINIDAREMIHRLN
jgi:hypothetical protein